MSLDCNNSASNYRNYADAASFDFADSFTVAGWINVHTRPSGVPGSAITRGTFTAAGHWIWGTENASPSNKFRFSWTNNGGTAYHAVGATTYSLDTWYHVVGWLDVNAASNKLRVYLNGAQDGVNAGVTGSMTALALPIRLFQKSDGTHFIDCSLAEVGIWNVALTTGEISALASGFDPLIIRPASRILVDRCLTTGAKDLIQGLGTDTGTLLADTGVRVFRHPRPSVSYATAGAAPSSTVKFFLGL